LYMNHSSSSAQNLGIPESKTLLREELDQLLASTNIVSFNRHEVIIRQHTPASHILFVKTGLVKIYKEGRNKRNFILKIAAPGEYLGLMSVFGSNMNQYSASCIEPAEIGYIDKKAFNTIIQMNGDFANGVIRYLSEEGLFIFDRLIGQSHKQLPGRIADVILYFSDTIYKKENFEFPFTRRELAELAGTTKESFIRTLSEFKNDKIIDLEGSRVLIRSMKIIRTLSELG
jgi:CRP/FNR family transcriptional regulator, polysaccharide utilization system transcription regulator